MQMRGVGRTKKEGAFLVRERESGRVGRRWVGGDEEWK